ncbi:hypothetical protein [Parasphingorhabdus sp.]|uniref:hypothetical protein n=1 Tax=Parasphingorhabdus sp. TaxID=2709688 RepID=UPI003262FECA
MNNKECALLICTAMIAFIPNTAQAEADGDNTKQLMSAKLTQSLAKVSEDGDPVTGNLFEQIQIVSDFGSSDAKITVDKTLDSTDGLGSTKFALTFTAPIDKKSDRSNFITETGLQNKLGVGFSFSTDLIPIPDLTQSTSNAALTRMDQLADLQADRCYAKRQKAIDIAYQEKLYQAEVYRLSSQKLYDEKVLEIKDTFRKKMDNANIEKQDRTGDCNIEYSQIYAVIKSGSNGKSMFLEDSEKQEFLKLWDDDGKRLIERPLLMANVSTSWGIEDFTFRDPVTFMKSKNRFSSFSLAASIGYMPQIKDPFIFFIGGEYKENYKASDKKILCQSNANIDPLECLSAVFAPPKKNKDIRVFGVMRWADPKLPFALELKGSYDVEDKNWGIEVPIYLLRNEKNQLNAGIKAAYDSEESDFKFGIFVTKAFDFSKI